MRNRNAVRGDLETNRLRAQPPATTDAEGDRAHALNAPAWDLVVDATGSIAAIKDGLVRVARGGTFLVFGVAPGEATARFSPFSVYNQEITVIGSMAVLHSFGRAVEMLASGAVSL